MEKFYEQENYPLLFVIGQNAFFLVYFGVGFIGLLPYKIYGFPMFSVLYVLFLTVMLLFVLRKHMCTNCYYYGKLCNTGWGKLSAFMFSKNSGNQQIGIKLAGITWMMASLIPTAGFVGTLIFNYSFLNLATFSLFVLLTIINFVIHKKACEKCEMRFTCPASMVKKSN